MNLFLMIHMIWAIYINQVHGYDCVAMRFPFVLGGTDGATEIKSILSDSTSLYFAGTSSDSSLMATGASKSVFYGSFDVSSNSVSWLSQITSTTINNVEGMGLEQSASFFELLLSSDTTTNALWLIRVNSANGNINRQGLIDANTITGISNLNARAISDSTYSYGLFSMTDESHIYIGVTTTTEDQIGLIKMTDFSANRLVDWYQSLSCTFCRMTSIVESVGSNDFIYTASILKDASNTFGQIHHFDSSGTFYWSHEFDMGAATISDYLVIRRMISLSAGTKLVAIMNGSGGSAYLTIFDNLSVSNHGAQPLSTTYTFSSSATDVIQQMQQHSSNSDQFLVIQTQSSGSRVLKFDISVLKYKAIIIPMSSGSTFQVYSFSKNAQGTSDGDFFYAGKTQQATDGATTQAFSQNQGFIQMSLTSNSDNNCLSDSNDYDPSVSSESSLLSDSTYTWSEVASAQSWSYTSINSDSQTGGLNSQSLSFVINSQQYWCTRLSSLTIQDPSELTSGIAYSSTTAALDTHFAFTTNDASCNTIDFTVAMTCTLSTGSWTTTPWLVQDIIDSSWHVNTNTSDNTQDGIYDCSFTVTHSTIDITAFSHLLNSVSVSILDQGCANVLMTAPSSTDSFQYQIAYNATTAQTFNLTSFTGYSSVSHCFIGSMSFLQPNNGTAIGNTWATAIYYDSSADTQFQVLTTDNNDESYGDSIGWIYLLQRTYTNVASGATVSQQIELEIVADCWTETITMPSTIYFADDTYTIYGSEKWHQCPDMENWTSSRASCQFWYGILTNGQNVSAFAYLEPQRGIRIYSTNNLYGHQVNYPMRYIAYLNKSQTMNQNKSSYFEYYLNTTKDCQYANFNLTSLGAVFSTSYPNGIVNYTVQSGIQTNNPWSVTFEKGCDVAYTFYFQSNGTGVKEYGQTAIHDNNDHSTLSTLGNSFSIECNDNRDSIVETDAANLQGIAIYANVYNFYYNSTSETQTASNPTWSPFTVYILPNCSIEAISVISSISAQEHWIHGDPTVVLIPAMQTDLAYCTIYTYNVYVSYTNNNGVAINDVNVNETGTDDIQNMFEFHISNMSLVVEINDNKYGGIVFQVTIEALNTADVSQNSTFQLTALKNCSSVTFTSNYSFSNSNESYQVGDAEKTIQLQNTQTSDQYCSVQYTLYYELDVTDSNGTFYQYTSGQQAFITGFDTSNTAVNSFISFTVQLTEQSLLQNYQTANFTIKIRSQLVAEELGNSNADQYSDMYLHIDSNCNNVIFDTTPTFNFNYFIRNTSITEYIPKSNLSWQDGTLSESDIHSLCGQTEYTLWNSTDSTGITIPSAILTGFVPGSFNNTNAQLQNSQISFYSIEPSLGGGIDDGSGNRYDQVTYNLHLIVKLTHGTTDGYYKNLGQINIIITVFDPCWTTRMYLGANQLSTMYANLQQMAQQNFSQILNTATDQTDYFSNYYVSRHDCGSIQYSIQYYNSSLQTYTGLDNSWVYFSHSSGSYENIFQLDTTTYAAEGQVLIKVYAEDERFVGYFQMAVYAQFVYDQNYPTQHFPVTVAFSPCVITSIFDPTVIQSQTFNIWGGRKLYIIDFSQLYQIPDCKYIDIYTSSLKDDITGGWNNTNENWPSYIRFVNDTTDSGSSMYYEVVTKDLSLEGTSTTFVFTVTFISNYDVLNTYVDYSIDIEWVLNFVYFPYNEPPSYLESIKSQAIEIGKSKTIKTGPASNDTISSSWDISNEDKKEKFKEFTNITIDRISHEITFEVKPYHLDQLGTYNLEVTISDEDEPEGKSTSYSFFILITIDISPNQSPLETNQTSDNVPDHLKEDQLNFTISQMDNEGNIVLQFNMEMNQTKFDLLEQLIFEELRKVLMLAVIPGPEQDLTKTTIKSFRITGYSSNQLNIQILFTDPQYISRKSQLDQLMVKVLDQSIISSTKGKTLLTGKNSQTYTKVPEQLAQDGQEFLKSAIKLQKSMQSLTLASLIGNLAWQYPINYVWGMINTLQITAHCQLVNTEVPSNIAIFNNITMKLIYFDILRPEILEKFYFWKIFDDSYNQFENEENEVLNIFRRRILKYQSNPILFEKNKLDQIYKENDQSKNETSNYAQEQTNSINQIKNPYSLEYVYLRQLQQNNGRKDTLTSQDVKQLTDQKKAQISDSVICSPTDSEFCNLEYMQTFQERIDFVTDILKQRNKLNQYNEVQIEALAAYEPPKGGNFVEKTQLERMAYGSTSIIENQGTVFVIWMLFFFYAIFIHLLRFICFPLMKKKCFHNYYMSMNKALFWGSFLRFGLEIYIESVIAAQINFWKYRAGIGLSEFSDLHNDVSYYYAIILGTFLIMYPILSAGFLLTYQNEINIERKNRTKYLFRYTTNKSLNEHDQIFVVLRKFGTIYDGVNTEYKSKILFYPLFMIRRLILSYILVQFQNYPQFQTIQLVFLNLFFAMYIGYVYPLDSKLANKIELYGEAINMAVCYNFFVFSEFVPDYNSRYNWAFTNIGYVTVLIIVNMIIIINNQVSQCIYCYNVRKRQRDQQKRQKLYDEILMKAKKDQDKKVAELLKILDKQDHKFISPEQRRQIAHGLMDKAIQIEIEKERQKRGGNKFAFEYNPLDANIQNKDEVKFHTSRFGQYNRFAEMMGKRVKIEQQMKPQFNSQDSTQADEEQWAFRIGRVKAKKLNLNFKNRLNKLDTNNNKFKLSTIAEKENEKSKDVSQDSDDSQQNVRPVIKRQTSITQSFKQSNILFELSRKNSKQNTTNNSSNMELLNQQGINANDESPLSLVSHYDSTSSQKKLISQQQNQDRNATGLSQDINQISIEDLERMIGEIGTEQQEKKSKQKKKLF